MKPRLEFPAPEDGYWLGTDDASGRHFIVVELSVGVEDFDAFYELTPEQHARFLTDRSAAAAFAEECSRQRHDDVLRFGWNRASRI